MNPMRTRTQDVKLTPPYFPSFSSQAIVKGRRNTAVKRTRLRRRETMLHRITKTTRMRQRLGQQLAASTVTTAFAMAVLFAIPIFAQDDSTGVSAPTPPEQPAALTAQTEGATVPRLVTFSGVLKDASGKAVVGTVTVAFSVYELQEGGSPLWIETQAVRADALGRYTVLLGATQPEGVPLDLFTTGRARWLGVQPQLA